MIFVLTGPVHSGKTTFLNKLIHRLERINIRIEGLLSFAIWENQKTIGYDLFDLKEKKSSPFIRRKGSAFWQKVGSYYFIPDGLAKAKELIVNGREAKLLVVDEIGPLELERRGLWPALESVLLSPPDNLILVIRENRLKDFLDLITGREVEIFDIQEKNAFSRMQEAVISHIKDISNSNSAE